MSDYAQDHYKIQEVEKIALGCILLDEKKIKSCVTYDPRVFSSAKHQLIFSAMRKMFHTGAPIDIITVVNYLDESGEIPDCGGHAYIAALTDDVASTANFSYYFNIIVETAKKRATRKAAKEYGEDFKELKKRLNRIDRLYKEMKADANELPLGDDTEEIPGDLAGNIDSALLVYDSPLNFAQALKSTAEDERDSWHEFFYYNPDIVAQACAALYFEAICGNIKEPRLKKSDRTVWQYVGAPLHYWRPVADLTKPKSPFEPISFLMGEEIFIKLLGQDFFIHDKEGKVKTKHYSRGGDNKIAIHFFTYCDQSLPQSRQFFMQRPMAAIPCQNGIYLLSEKKLIKHSPNHNQTIPAFPYNYMEPDKLNAEYKSVISVYLKNLCPPLMTDEEEMVYARYLGFRIGYTLTPWRIKKFFVDIGPGDTGKTKFLENIGRLHRETDTLRHADLYKMAQKPDQFDSAVFEEALVVFNDDFPPAAKLPAQVLKMIANKNTTIQISQKYKAVYSRINTSTIMLSTNSEPKSPDSYISNRIVCTPFETVFDESEENDALMNKMEEPAVEETLFNYGIHCMSFFMSCAAFEDILPGCVKTKTDEVIKALNDTVEWIREAIDSGAIVVVGGLRIKKNTLYDMYYKARGSRSVGRNTFYMEVKKIYPERVSGGIGYFDGIGPGIQDEGEFNYD